MLIIKDELYRKQLNFMKIIILYLSGYPPHFTNSKLSSFSLTQGEVCVSAPQVKAVAWQSVGEQKPPLQSSWLRLQTSEELHFRLLFQVPLIQSRSPSFSLPSWQPTFAQLRKTYS
jgi:hypothetical protein